MAEVGVILEIYLWQWQEKHVNFGRRKLHTTTKRKLHVQQRAHNL